MKSETQKKVMSEELALNELEKFINEWVDKPEPKEKLAESYPNILDGLISGNLVLNENNEPIYTLRNPVKSEDGTVIKSEVKFKTRILPTTQESLSKGVDLNKDQVRFMNICIAHISGCTVKAELDLFSKKDFNTIREISTVFI
ncbi:hypothetical protein D3C87_1597500 [compost metagenome]